MEATNIKQHFVYLKLTLRLFQTVSVCCVIYINNPHVWRAYKLAIIVVIAYVQEQKVPILEIISYLIGSEKLD